MPTALLAVPRSAPGARALYHMLFLLRSRERQFGLHGLARPLGSADLVRRYRLL
jgi:hypothetical protein